MNEKRCKTPSLREHPFPFVHFTLAGVKYVFIYIVYVRSKFIGIINKVPLNEVLLNINIQMGISEAGGP